MDIKKQGMGEPATSPSVNVNPFSIGAMPDLRAGVIAMHRSQGALLDPLETENNWEMSQTLKYLRVELVEEERGDCEGENNEDRSPKYLQRVFVTRHLEAFSENFCWGR